MALPAGLQAERAALLHGSHMESWLCLESSAQDEGASAQRPSTSRLAVLIDENVPPHVLDGY